jgi:hypothetical protein
VFFKSLKILGEIPIIIIYLFLILELPIEQKHQFLVITTNKKLLLTKKKKITVNIFIIINLLNNKILIKLFMLIMKIPIILILTLNHLLLKKKIYLNYLKIVKNKWNKNKKKLILLHLINLYNNNCFLIKIKELLPNLLEFNKTQLN